MTQENKDLLLKDLCGRIPYKVYCKVDDGDTALKLYSCNADGTLTFSIEFANGAKSTYNIEKVVPYLRPMSTMTEEEYWELSNYTNYNETFVLQDNTNDKIEREEAWAICNAREVDWLNANGFDFRGLIEKGLAEAAPKYMYVKSK